MLFERWSETLQKMSPAWFAWRYIRKAADQTDHFADVFVRENVDYEYDIVTTLWRSKVLCLEKSNVRKWTI